MSRRAIIFWAIPALLLMLQVPAIANGLVRGAVSARFSPGSVVTAAAVPRR